MKRRVALVVIVALAWLAGCRAAKPRDLGHPAGRHRRRVERIRKLLAAAR